MRIRRLQTIVGIVLVIGVVMVSWNFAEAYILGSTWASNSATYYYHSSLPVNWQSGVTFGANRWTNVTTSSWTWSLSNGSSNLIKLGALDGADNALGVTTLWISNGKIIQIEIKFDQAENWYLGSSTPGSNQVDLRSSAAHEFGHGLGLSHTQSSNCVSPRSTMCDKQFKGSIEFRSLENDDKNGLTSAYP